MSTLVTIKWPWLDYMELDAMIVDFGYAGKRPVARTTNGTIWRIYRVLGLFLAVRWKSENPAKGTGR
jgi:hypothetical protein